MKHSTLSSSPNSGNTLVVGIPRRVIKFRAFDDGKLIYPTGALADIKRFFRVIRHDAVPMQFTGLTDKNGKEVYHKDILKGKGFYWIIEWQNEEARFIVLPCGRNTKNWLFMDEVDRMEVVGNVFETPELLG